MPSNRVLTILIISFGLITSIWLFARDYQKEESVAKNNIAVIAEPAIKIEKPLNDDWKKILKKIDGNEKVTNVIKNSSTNEEDDTTLTDQMSRDFLSQYLMAVKEGINVTPEVATQIAQNTLSLPGYKQTSVVYIKENLKIVSKSDFVTIQKYKESINQALIPIYYSIKDEPMTILLNSLSKEEEADLKKLDPIITINKNAIRNLLDMEVPEGATKLHLDLLNVCSQILSDLEAMRVALTDPVMVSSAIGNYANHVRSFGISISNLNAYFIKNTPKLVF